MSDPTGYATLVTTRGYTGHEQLDPVGLVHMNGRVYDPEIGRFVSADPEIQFPFNLQSLNRYSYVLNNPLSFTDPTGLYAYAESGSWGSYYSYYNSLDASGSSGSTWAPSDTGTGTATTETTGSAIGQGNAIYSSAPIGLSPTPADDECQSICTAGMTYQDRQSDTGGGDAITRSASPVVNADAGTAGAKTPELATTGTGGGLPDALSGDNYESPGNGNRAAQIDHGAPTIPVSANKSDTLDRIVVPAATLFQGYQGAPFVLPDDSATYELIRNAFRVAEPIGSALKQQDYVAAAASPANKEAAIEDGAYFIIPSKSYYKHSFLLQNSGNHNGMDGIFEYIIPISDDFLLRTPKLSHQRVLPNAPVSGHPTNFGGKNTLHGAS